MLVAEGTRLVFGRGPGVDLIVARTRDAIRRGKLVRDMNVAALQVTPVHYLFKPDDEAMVSHFRRMADETGMPIIIYNVVPWSYLSPALLTRIDGLRELGWQVDVRTLGDGFPAPDAVALASAIASRTPPSTGRSRSCCSSPGRPPTSSGGSPRLRQPSRRCSRGRSTPWSMPPTARRMLCMRMRNS